MSETAWWGIGVLLTVLGVVLLVEHLSLAGTVLVVVGMVLVLVHEDGAERGR